VKANGYFWVLSILLGACNKDNSEDSGWDPAQGDACLSCHDGTENVHPEAIDYGDCTSCHGGDATGLSLEKAHVPVPENWAEVRGSGLPPAPNGYIKDMPPDMLDQLDEAYIRFINPGDLRAAEAACGGCHEGYVERIGAGCKSDHWEEGMHVIFAQFAGQEISVDEDIYLVLPEEDVLVYGWDTENE